MKATFMALCLRGLKKITKELRTPVTTPVKEEVPHVTEKEINENKELKKLQLFGAGPKMMGLGIYPTDGNIKPTNSFRVYYRFILESDENDVRRSRRIDVNLKSPVKNSPKKEKEIELKCIKCKAVHS